MAHIQIPPMTQDETSTLHMEMFKVAVKQAERACVITGKTNCQERDCELHYSLAPLKLAPEK